MLFVFEIVVYSLGLFCLVFVLFALGFIAYEEAVEFAKKKIRGPFPCGLKTTTINLKDAKKTMLGKQIEEGLISYQILVDTNKEDSKTLKIQYIHKAIHIPKFIRVFFKTEITSYNVVVED